MYFCLRPYLATSTSGHPLDHKLVKGKHGPVLSHSSPIFSRHRVTLIMFADWVNKSLHVSDQLYCKFSWVIGLLIISSSGLCTMGTLTGWCTFTKRVEGAVFNAIYKHCLPGIYLESIKINCECVRTSFCSPFYKLLFQSWTKLFFLLHVQWCLYPDII